LHSNKIDEGDTHHKKLCDARISIEAGIIRFDDFEKL
jgi:hypothetical protein